VDQNSVKWIKMLRQIIHGLICAIGSICHNATKYPKRCAIMCVLHGFRNGERERATPTQGQLCVLKKFTKNFIFHPIYMNKVRLNGNSTWNIIANLHEKLANNVSV
jgi:hypothetical protein